MITINYPTNNTVFRSRNVAPRLGAAHSQGEPTIYRAMRGPVEEAELTCDRCATDKVPMVGVIVDPEAQVVRVFCGSCYPRTRLARLAHREWRTFEATGTDRWDRELLTTVLTSAGLLDARKAGARRI
jgi:hypothetical protein